MPKKLLIENKELKELIPPMGTCLATDKITVEGLPVGFFYREEPRFEQDTGWRFFSGTEDQTYANDPKNSAVYDVNTIANYDQAIIPFLNWPIGMEFARTPGTDIFKMV